LSDTTQHRSLLNILSVIALVGLLINILIFNLDGINRLKPSLQANIGGQKVTRSASPLEVAQELHRLEIKESDKVAVIGYGFDSFWARLARVKIIAELPEEQAGDFWIGDETLRQEVLQTFASTGARAVVAEYVPAYAQLNGWHQVSGTNYFIYRLKE
jgi:hypothetical protein